MSIWFDRARTIVAGCTDCAVRDVFTTQAAADNWAVQHAQAWHPADGSTVLASLHRRQNRRRHA